MEPITANERLLLLVTHVPPAGPLAAWLPKLPYLSSLAERGIWARVKRPPPAAAAIGQRPSADWSSFATGMVQTAESPDDVPAFWSLLKARGKRVMVCGVPEGGERCPGLPCLSGITDAQPLVSQPDWDLLIAVDAGVGGLGPKDARLGRWQAWDQAIAPLGLAAGAQTAVMVLGLPADSEDGVLIAGGGFIAQAGDLGTVNLLDLAPTILWLLDIAPTQQMTGRVWDELWRPEAGWTDAEQEALFAHLRGLGYLS